MRHGKIIHTMEMLQSSAFSPGEARVKYLPAQHCFHPPTNPAVSLFIYLTAHLSIHLPSSAVIQLCLCICSPIHLSVRPGIHHSSVHPSSVCCPFACPIIPPFTVFLCICPPRSCPPSPPPIHLTNLLRASYVISPRLAPGMRGCLRHSPYFPSAVPLP